MPLCVCQWRFKVKFELKWRGGGVLSRELYESNADLYIGVTLILLHCNSTSI
jgi:hypothetical protein